MQRSNAVPPPKHPYQEDMNIKIDELQQALKAFQHLLDINTVQFVDSKQDNEEQASTRKATQAYFWDLKSKTEELSIALHKKSQNWNSFIELVDRHHFTLTESSACEGYFSFLPNELFFHILNYLTDKELGVASLVNKKWKHLCDDPFLWRSLYILSTQKRLSSLSNKVNVTKSIYYESKPGSSCYDDFNHSPRLENWKQKCIQRQIIDNKWKKGLYDKTGMKTLVGHTAWICCLRFDDEHIVSSAGDRTVRIWDINTGETVDVLKATRGVLCLQFDKLKIIGGCMDNNIHIWGRNKSQINSLEGHNGRVWAIQYDNEKLVSGAADKTIKFWDLESLKLSKSLDDAHQDGLSCLQFDERVLASGATDTDIKLWDPKNYNQVGVLAGEHTKAIFCLALLGNTLLSGSHDATIKEWDLRMNRCVKTYEGHSKSVFAVQFDSKKVVSCSGDGTIKVWDKEIGHCYATLEKHKDAIRALQYDDSKIISGASTKDKTIKIWNFDS